MMTTAMLWGAIFGIVLLIVLILRTIKRLWVPFLFSACTGLGALALINLTAPLTGASIPISLLSLGCSLLGGVPGVIALLAVRLIWPL